MSKNPNRDYFDFYLMGRDEASDDADELELDYAKLGAQVVDGEDVREVAMGAARGIKIPDGDLNTWRKSSRALRTAIDAAGGDTGRAYNQYCKGYVDELAACIELSVLEAIAEEAEDDESEGDGEDEDEDED